MPQQVAADILALLPARPELTRARTRLFAMALHLFAERGYHGVSVRDITDALGQKPGAIYAHVQSKQELLFEIVKIGHVVHRDRLRAGLEASDPDPVQQMTGVVTAHVLAHLEYPQLARVTNQEFKFLDQAQVESILAIRSETELMMLHIIERGARLGEFSTTEPFLAATAIGSMGIRTTEWWRPDLPKTAEQVAAAYARFAIDMLR